MDKIRDDLELQRMLWACYRYWQTMISEPLDERVICYKWVVGMYEKEFGTRFHQSSLQRLAKLGFLSKAGTSRGGKRRYYKLVNPDQVAEALRGLGLL